MMRASYSQKDSSVATPDGETIKVRRYRLLFVLVLFAAGVKRSIDSVLFIRNGR